MGRSVVNLVIDALQSAGIRAQRAMPSGVMPQLQSAAVAVQLAQVDQAAATVTVLVTVLVPIKLGGGSCEDLAVQVSSVLAGMGAVCRQEKLVQPDKIALLAVPVYAKFAGYETAEGWQPREPDPEPLTFSVSLRGVPCANVVRFSAWRQGAKPEEIDTGLADACWYFSLEELVPLDAAEVLALTDPFTITVSRPGRTEAYVGCRFFSQRRVITDKGLSQIREGVAESLNVV